MPTMGKPAPVGTTGSGAMIAVTAGLAIGDFGAVFLAEDFFRLVMNNIQA